MPRFAPVVAINASLPVADAESLTMPPMTWRATVTVAETVTAGFELVADGIAATVSHSPDDPATPYHWQAGDPDESPDGWCGCERYAADALEVAEIAAMSLLIIRARHAQARVDALLAE